MNDKPQHTPTRYSDDRLSLAQEIAATLRARGHFVPKEWAGPDIIMAVGLALDLSHLERIAALVEAHSALVEALEGLIEAVDEGFSPSDYIEEARAALALAKG